MHIKEYMFRKQFTSVELAKLLGCSRQQITAIRLGKRPGKRFAKDLVEFTEGLVSMDEILNPAPFLGIDEEIVA